ncbi:MAG: sirohydrochlorin cobaltochelatase, partial [Eubacteriales bacterium]|nr:sirohydrochlorin cobaltochelatase [Eubacteriales bacterium]
DMAGDDDDSWKSMFEADGSFESITPQIAGLGRVPAVQEVYKAHAAAAIDAESVEETGDAAAAAGDAGDGEEAAETGDGDASAVAADTAAVLEDGIYTAVFTTDKKSMFHVNEAYEDKGTLTVQDGQMTIHVSLASKKIVNLFPGTAEDARKEGAELLQPTEDEVTCKDGTKETVYGFDIPVPVIGEEFDCALIGTKGKWYDHKATVSDPVPAE